MHAHVIHESALVQVTAWRCLHDGEELRAERTQTDHVLTLLATGACAIEQGRWRTTLDPCTSLFHLPGSTYRTLHPFGHGDSGWSLAFASDVAGEHLDRAGDKPATWRRPSRTRTLAPASLLPAVVPFHRATRGQPTDPLALDEAAMHLLRSQSQGRKRSERSTVHRRLADRASAFANAHFRSPLRLSDVARAVGCSPFHLSRVFKQQRGTTLANYVRDLRLSFVVARLAQGRSSLAELAFEAGFSSHAHLTDTFRSATGLPPSRVRSKILEASAGTSGAS